MTRDEFRARVGREPQQDDLERANCNRAGKFGHYLCGVCDLHRAPRFVCGCLHPASHRDREF